MNRVVLVLLLVLTVPGVSNAAKEWYNQPQYLTKIPSNTIGDILKRKPGGGNLLPTVVSLTQNNSPTVNIASGILSIPIYAYHPLAGAAGQYALGYLLSAGIDLASTYGQGVLQENPSFADLINDLFGPNGSTTPSVGDIVKSDTNCGQNLNIISYGTILTGFGLPDWESSNSCSYGGGSIRCFSGGSCYAKVNDDFIYYSAFCENGICRGVNAKQVTVYRTSDNATWPRVLPDVLNLAQLAQLATEIANRLANNPTFKQAAENLLRDNPELVPDVRNITNNEVQNYAQENNYKTNQEYIDYLTNQYNSYEGNTEMQNYYAQKLEEAKKEQEKEDNEDAKDNFAPIDDNPFQNPYNPGEFDIPARFTAFLNTVKSSGLFSFSSSFFNSLPGGGSPVYEIEAGQYGHHTIDLSQTLSTGLAILKTVLLLCFGFLSIRAIIMKR